MYLTALLLSPPVVSLTATFGNSGEHFGSVNFNLKNTLFEEILNCSDRTSFSANTDNIAQVDLHRFCQCKSVTPVSPCSNSLIIERSNSNNDCPLIKTNVENDC